MVKYEGHIIARNKHYFLVEMIEAIELLDLRSMTATIETNRRGLFHREKVRLNDIITFSSSAIESQFGFCILVRRSI